MTIDDRKTEAQRRREAVFYQMQQNADARQKLEQQFREAQIALYKLDGEIDLLNRMALGE
jgi:hypothetical protein